MNIEVLVQGLVSWETKGDHAEMILCVLEAMPRGRAKLIAILNSYHAEKEDFFEQYGYDTTAQTLDNIKACLEVLE